MDRIASSRAIGLDRKRSDLYKNELTDELDRIACKVKGGEYQFTPFKEKLISKGAGAHPRVISIPTVRDRLTLRALCDLLSEVFPEAVPQIPQVKVEALREGLEAPGYDEYVKIDLSQFYPSIDHTKLLEVLKRKIRKREILHLISNAITTPTVSEQKGGKGAARSKVGVPQGLAISNPLAEIFLSGVDKEMATRSDILYLRYVDDILILCKKGQSLTVAGELCSRLESLNLKPHRVNGHESKSKCGPLLDEFDFLGYRVKNRRLSIRKQSINKFESSLAKIFTSYRHKLKLAKNPSAKKRAMDVCRWRLNLRITGCIFRGKRLGWVFYFSQITDTSRLRAVDNTVSSLLKRFFLEKEISPKKTLKTYYECRRRDKSGHSYIPNFDTMPTSVRREILVMLIGRKGISTLPDKRINQLFEMRISAAVKELEEDLANTS